MKALIGDDSDHLAAAYSGLLRSLERVDLPSVAEIVQSAIEGRHYYILQACLVSMEMRFRTAPEAALRLDDEVLRKVLAFHFTWLGQDESGWFDALAKVRPELVAEVLAAYALPMLRKGKEHVHGLWPLAGDEKQAEVARLALPALLMGFPLRAKQALLDQALVPLLHAALRYLASDVLAGLLAQRLAQGSMSAAQRVHWLTCGLLLSPADYEEALARHVGASKALTSQLGGFLHASNHRQPSFARLTESACALLIERLSPDCSPDRPKGAHWVTTAMQTSDEVRALINTLAANPSDAASQQLQRLLALPRLALWHDALRHAAQAQRIARRKATFRPPDAKEVCRTLADRQPANAADLAALTYEHLRDLGRKIRDGSTNDYRQYWSLDEANRQHSRPKPENECRDALLSDLKERLGRLGIDAIQEGYFAEEKRADIRVSFGGATGFNIPIEIKKDEHRDLWRAIREQLIERYTRDPGAEGYGIYLVFWFGGKGMPIHPGGLTRNATELEQRLQASLNAEESRRIRVCVLDCSLP